MVITTPVIVGIILLTCVVIGGIVAAIVLSQKNNVTNTSTGQTTAPITGQTTASIPGRPTQPAPITGRPTQPAPACMQCGGKCGGPDGCNKGGTCPNYCPEGQECKIDTCVKKKADMNSCKSDADCSEFASRGYGLCDIWTNTGCVTDKCAYDFECLDPSNKFCDKVNKNCHSTKGEALLGPEGGWHPGQGGLAGQYVPTCSDNSVRRSNSGWCRESSSSKCPDGWEIRTVVGNPNGNGLGGSEVRYDACVPTRKGPPGWIFDQTLNMFVPPCKTEKKFREEGWCVYSGSGDCLDGYSKFTNRDGMGVGNYIDYCGPTVPK